MIYGFLIILAISIFVFYLVSHSLTTRRKVIVDVVGVVDGRTIEVRVEGRNSKVILAGIGFPAGDEKAEYDANTIVTEMVTGRRLYMEIFKETDGLRYVTLASSNGDCLNKMLLQRGLARYESNGVGFIASMIQAENEARMSETGIWDKNRALFKHITGDHHAEEDLMSGASTIDDFEEA